MPVSIGPTSLDIPAWVQAIGSIAAIMFAILVSSQDRRRKTKEDERRHQSLRILVQRVVRSAIHDASALLAENIWHISEPGEIEDLLGYFDGRLSSIRYALDQIKSVPLHEWPDVEFGIACLNWSRMAESACLTIASLTPQIEGYLTNKAYPANNIITDKESIAIVISDLRTISDIILGL